MPRPPSLPTESLPPESQPPAPSVRPLVSRLCAIVLPAVVALGLLGSPAAANAQTTASLPPPIPRAAVVDARFGLHPDMTRFVLELSDTVPFTVTLAADPYRVVVDLPELAWPGGSRTVEGKGMVARYRHAGGAPAGGTRVTFDTVGPAKVRSAFMIPARDGHQPRFVLDLEKTTPAEFRRIAKGAPPAAAGASQGPGQGAGRGEQARGARDPGGHEMTMSSVIATAMTVPEAPGEAGGTGAAAAGVVTAPPPFVPLPPIPPAQLMTASLPAVPPPPEPAAKPPTAAEKPLIVLDPGHGGQDPGAIGVGGIYEKDITLATAKEVKRQLERTGRYRVRLTRDSDVFIRLRDRVALGREAGADLFISLHADSISSGDVRGLSIYTLSDKASDREAEMLAAKENRSDALVGLDLSGENALVANILIDLAQRDTMNHSKRFATLALQNLGRDIPLIPSKPHRQAGFAVLTAPDVPSALIEMGYLSNRRDVSLLISSVHRERLGKGLARTIDAYFKWLLGAQRT
ncbi:N-acetylmuramoyl-L-alanine amidase [Azospirillum picis]|uniref:N-acetylmuramoyl-L-alanine amidase n=1 Tax=Azospirillum picis TaxID=488438 RepID=A0ABU0MR10_9PROT|nr:N-acetylmuramoyl-L-alanine amidase [Azospirillum picis]MBP2302333.1 N-acetylmuramoyl-L-alanine amidase [Azospirillum picis]MDQ0535912.1 N-acetylmuramoyl-L-alanine amidase [Azospirillum picis]